MSQYDVSEVPQLVAPRDAARLHKIGAHNTGDVLRQGGTAQGRRALARRSHVELATIDRLARRADLLRLTDIGPEHVLLLESAGVRSIADLASRDPALLAPALEAKNRARKLVDLMPGRAQIARWCAQAKSLPVILR